jgi:hypothetical protein
MYFRVDKIGAKVNSQAQAELEKKPAMMKMYSYRRFESAQYVFQLIAC